jgi:hypothetical protein
MRDDAGWEAKLVKLQNYQRRHGDCNVPQKWAEDPPLGKWVSHQRQGKRALDRGEPSERMTAARAAKLEALGFAWELSASWEAQLGKLKAYKQKHGDCNVPKGWAEDPRLGTWVNNLRMLKWQLDGGEPGQGLTAERAAKLTALGFAWGPGKNGLPTDAVCPYCATCDTNNDVESGDKDENQPQRKTRQRRKAMKGRIVNRLGNFWCGIGYSGDSYCKRCAEVFRDHLIRERSNSANCSRSSPCDECAKMLVFFPPDIWAQTEKKAEQNELKRQTKARELKRKAWELN